MEIIPADYWLILCMFYYWLRPATALFSGRFPVTFRFLYFQLPWLVSAFEHSWLKCSNQPRYTALGILCCYYRFTPYDITQHLLSIIIYSFGQYRVKHPDQLTRNRYDRLHLLQRIPASRPVIVIDLSKLFILSYHRNRSFIQCISQALSSPVTDSAFSVMLTGTVCNNGLPCQLLQLLWIIKTTNVTHFCYKTAYRF